MKSRSNGSGAKTTVNHNEIKRWVESRNGKPATVKGTGRGSEDAGLLRIDFPGYSGEGTLESIGWTEFFEKFAESNLAFLYDPSRNSRFNKFIARGPARPSNRSTNSRSRARSGGNSRSRTAAAKSSRPAARSSPRARKK